VTHDKLLKIEELKAEDLFSFEKPVETIDHAVFVQEKLYLKSENYIIVANEGGNKFPKRPQSSKLTLVYSTGYGLKCLGELEGITQEVDVLYSNANPDPNA